MKLPFKEKAYSILLALWVILAPIRPAMAAVFILPMVDLVLGLIAARKAKEPITSARLKRTVVKLFLYETSTVLAFIAETYLTGPLIPAIRIVTGYIGAVELKSCLEHLDELNGNPLFATIVSRLAPPSNDPSPPEGRE